MSCTFKYMWALHNTLAVGVSCTPVSMAVVQSIPFECHHVHTKAYTGCPRRNVPDFGKVFLMIKYTDITQNTYVQS